MDVTGANDLLLSGVHGLLSGARSGFAPRIVEPRRAGRDPDGLVVVVEDPGQELPEPEAREIFGRTGRALYVMAGSRPVKQRAALVHGASVVVGHHLPADQLQDRARRVVQRPTGTTPRSVLVHGLALGLTPRGVDVAVRITRGYSNAEIAEDLHLSINTVKTYIRQVYRVLGADNRVEASFWYQRDVPSRDGQRGGGGPHGGQEPPAASGSSSATHSTWCVIGKTFMALSVGAIACVRLRSWGRTSP